MPYSSARCLYSTINIGTRLSAISMPSLRPLRTSTWPANASCVALSHVRGSSERSWRCEEFLMHYLNSLRWALYTKLYEYHKMLEHPPGRFCNYSEDQYDFYILFRFECFVGEGLPYFHYYFCDTARPG